MSEQDKAAEQMAEDEFRREALALAHTLKQTPGGDMEDKKKAKSSGVLHDILFLIIFFGAIVFVVIGPYRAIFDNIADAFVAVACLIIFARILKALLTMLFTRRRP